MGEAGAEASDVLDSFGLPLSTTMTACANSINAYYDAVLAYKPFSSWAIAERAVEQDPQCPMARVLAADYAFCSGNAARFKELMTGLESESEEGRKSWTWRECRYVEAWTKWTCQSDPGGCYKVLLDVVVKHPSDLFAVKRGHIMGLILGDGAKILEIVEKAAASVSMSPPPRYLHGMWSFGLEQSLRYEEAEEKAREGFAFEKELGSDAWLDHAFAHALYFQGEERLDDALEYLQAKSPTWDASALHPFLYTHLWWHLSLLHCERRAFSDTLAIFDERLWADKDDGMKSDPQVQLNALNLLWRLETRGRSVDAKPRWKKVIAACHGVTLPEIGVEGRAPLQHSDLLLDILLVRAFCANAAEDPGSLESWLRAIAAHAAELAKSAAGGEGRAEAYDSIANSIAELYRSDQKEAGLPARHAKARKDLKALQSKWEGIGGSLEQRGVLLEAMDAHPVVCGAPEVNFDTLFLG